MGVFYLFVDGIPHKRERITQTTTICSCGDMQPASGSAGGMANAWRAHVDAEAERLGVPVEKRDGGKVLHDSKPRPVYCGNCHWQGLRKTPWDGYRGPAGPCPKCGVRVQAVRNPTSAKRT